MDFEDRKNLLGRVESLREGRRLICLFHFDRATDPSIDGLGVSSQFDSDAKEAMFRVLILPPFHGHPEMRDNARGVFLVTIENQLEETSNEAEVHA